MFSRPNRIERALCTSLGNVKSTVLVTTKSVTVLCTSLGNVKSTVLVTTKSVTVFLSTSLASHGVSSCGLGITLPLLMIKSPSPAALRRRSSTRRCIALSVQAWCRCIALSVQAWCSPA